MFSCRYPAARIVVTAHTDSIGPDDYKTRSCRSGRRSPSAEFSSTWESPRRESKPAASEISSPAAPNDTPEGRRANRRVTIDILPEEEAETK